ncbi:MAG: TonB-dependent receptor [Paludibacteraceae bacterium]|nr:TonB-dependent receptor [Paludibacteraceae bacterium]
MKTNRLLLILLLALVAATAGAQNLITGVVYDAASERPLDYANVVVYREGEDEPLDGTTTDEDGMFWLYRKVKAGDYKVTVSFMGYIDQIFSVHLTGKEVSLGKIYLEENTRALKEVEVVGQGSTMRFELDKKVFTVDQSISSAGASVSEVLENIPSVEVDQEGTISLRNSEDVEIWINGKPAGLTAENRAEILQQMPAEAIKEIELITNPSAKFSPEGTAGIINLVLKKDRKAGYYGSLNAGIDYSLAKPWTTLPSGKLGFNINFNKGIVDAYMNVGYNYRNSNGASNSDRYNFMPTDTTRLIKYGNGQNRGGGGMFIRAGVDVHVTDRSTIGLSGFTVVSAEKDPTANGNYAFFSGFRNAPVLYELYDVDYYVDPQSNDNSEELLRSYHRDQSGRNVHPTYNALLSWQFEISKMHNLSMSAQYDNNRFMQDQYYTQFETATPDDKQVQNQYSDMRNQSLQLKADYEFKIASDMRLGLGWQSTLGWRKSTSDAWDGEGKQDAFHLENYFNNFTNNEQTHALYTTYGYTVADRLSVMAGLRAEIFHRDLITEYYDSPGSLKTVTSDTTYFQLYPSVFASYDFGGGHELQINYTRRVERPRGRQINPRMDFSDSTNISFGSPSLLPSYSSSVELNYLKNWDRHVLSAGFFWRFREGVIQNIKFMDGTTMKNTYVNFKTRHEVGIEVVAKNKLFGEIINLTTSVQMYYNGYAGGTFTSDLYGKDFSVVIPKRDVFAANVSVNAQFMFTKTFSGSLSGRYRSPHVLAQGMTTHSYSIDAGLRKTFLDKKLILALNVRDIFNSRARTSKTYGDGFWQYQENRWNSRMVSFSITYNFGNQQGAKKQNRQNDGGVGDDDMGGDE